MRSSFVSNEPKSGVNKEKEKKGDFVLKKINPKKEKKIHVFRNRIKHWSKTHETKVNRLMFSEMKIFEFMLEKLEKNMLKYCIFENGLCADLINVINHEISWNRFILGSGDEKNRREREREKITEEEKLEVSTISMDGNRKKYTHKSRQTSGIR